MSRLTIVSLAAIVALGVCLSNGGCATPLGGQSQFIQPPAPIYVPAADSTRVWERIVEVLHEFHFTIAREDRRAGVIETDTKPGASVLEPWHRDTVDRAQRWESTLQSIRRRVVVSFQPAGDGGNFIQVRVDKEIEDLPGPNTNAAGPATLSDNSTLQRNLDRVVGSSRESTWLPRGQDPALERVLTERIRAALVW